MVGADNFPVLSALLVAAVAALAGVLAWRERRARMLSEAANQLDGIVRDGRYAERVRGAGNPAQPFAATANKLLEQIAVKDLLISERERALVGLLSGLHEAVAVHRDGIVFANARFAALTGQGHAQQLIGRSMGELVHPDYRDLVGEQLRRVLDAVPAMDRLEVELQPQRDQPIRVELSAVRIDYQGGPALLLTMLEMGPRPAAAPAATTRGRPTAWDTLDSLGEGIITTDISGRIDYLNRAAEQLVGISASDALGKTITDIITLVDETDRRSLGDPVRQCLTTAAKNVRSSSPSRR
jgi:PAS domain S-box-containing protein